MEHLHLEIHGTFTLTQREKRFGGFLLQPPPIDSPTYRPPTTLLLPIDTPANRHQLTLKQRPETFIIT